MVLQNDNHKMNENVLLALPGSLRRQSNVECLCAIVLIDRNCVLSTVEFVHFVGNSRRINNAELIIVYITECRQQQSTTIVPALHFDTLNEKTTPRNGTRLNGAQDISLILAFTSLFVHTNGIYIVSSK